jgi:hypothetical protein
MVLKDHIFTVVRFETGKRWSRRKQMEGKIGNLRKSGKHLPRAKRAKGRKVRVRGPDGRINHKHEERNLTF